MAIKELECKICNLEIPSTHQILSTEHWRIRHSQETNILGYCILESRRHFLDLSEANREELADYGAMLAAIMKAQRRLLQCERVYTFSLAEAVPHFHVHVIPRVSGFPRGFKGRGIMSYPTVPAADSSLVESTSRRLKNAVQRAFADSPAAGRR